MGSRPPQREADAAESTVSPLWIAGCAFTPACGDPEAAAGELETIGQTAIDRFRGAAASGPLRFSRLAARGGTLTVYMRHDETGGQPLSTADLELISRWQPAVGRDRTKGSGRATLTNLQHGPVDPATPAGALTWLSHSGPGLFQAVATGTITRDSTDQPWLAERFKIEDGFLTWDSQPGAVIRTRQRQGQPFIPGSAWKGIIRSRTEYILRSRYGETAVCPQPGCGTCPVCAIFGHPGQRGLLAFRDSYLEDPSIPPERTQVGIDRVTGGSRDALLFTSQPVASGQLMLQIDALGDIAPWVRNVIRHVLRDIHDGLIGVGSRTTRGLGTLRLLSQPSDPGPVVVPELESTAAETEPAS